MEPENTSITIGEKTYIRSFSHAKMKVVPESQVPDRVVARQKKYNKTAAGSAFQDDKTPDLVWVQFVLDTEGGNKNWDYMPREALVANYKTAIYKPFNMNHVVSEQATMMDADLTKPPVTNTIFGMMAQSNLCNAEGIELSDKEVAALDMADNPNRDAKDKIGVSVWGAFYAFLFPKTTQDVVDNINDDTIFVSMERWIADYDYLVWDGSKYNEVSIADAEKQGVDQQWAKHTKVNGKEIWRRSLSFVYGGGAATKSPANQNAIFLDPATYPAAIKAAAEDAENILDEKNYKYNSDYLQLFAVSLLQGINTAGKQIVSHTTEMNIMADEIKVTPAVLDEATVAKAVEKALSHINEQKDREAAIAREVKTLATDKAIAENATVAARDELAKANQSLKALTDDAVTAKSDKEASTKSITELTGRVEAAEKARDAAQVELKKIATEKSIAGRIELVEKAALPDATKATLKANSSKLTESGDFEVSDEALKSTVAEYVAIYEAGKTSAATTATETPGEVAPVEPKVDGDNTPAPDLSTAGDKAKAIASITATASDKSKVREQVMVLGCAGSY